METVTASTSVRRRREQADVGTTFQSTAINARGLLDFVHDLENFRFGVGTTVYDYYIHASMTIGGNDGVRSPIGPIEPVFKQGDAKRMANAHADKDFSALAIEVRALDNVFVGVGPVYSLVDVIYCYGARPQDLFVDHRVSVGAVQISSLDDAMILLQELVPNAPEHYAVVSCYSQTVDVRIRGIQYIRTVLEGTVAGLDVHPAVGEVNVRCNPIDGDMEWFVDVVQRDLSSGPVWHHGIYCSLIRFRPVDYVLPEVEVDPVNLRSAIAGQQVLGGAVHGQNANLVRQEVQKGWISRVSSAGTTIRREGIPGSAGTLKTSLRVFAEVTAVPCSLTLVYVFASLEVIG